MHPVLAEPRTKEEWREYLAATPPSRPAMPSHHAYQAMPDIERKRFNRRRAAYHSAGKLVVTPDVEKLHYELARRLEVNRHQPAGARRGKVIDGPPTVGKSTLIKWFARDFENELRALEPERFVTDDGQQYARDYIPVVYVSIGSQYSPKDLSIAIAEFLMMPYRRAATKTELTNQILKAMRLCGTELVVFDEAHYLDLSQKEGKVANDHLKHLANHTAATFVYTGVNLEASGLFLEGRAKTHATQTAGRNDLHKVRPLAIDTGEQARQWAAIIASMESGLLLFRHQPGSLAQCWRYLHDRTGGSIASLSHLIRESASDAVHNGTEAITPDLMDTIVIDQRAHEHYQIAIKKRERNTATQRRSALAQTPETRAPNQPTDAVS